MYPSGTKNAHVSYTPCLVWHKATLIKMSSGISRSEGYPSAVLLLLLRTFGDQTMIRAS